MQLYLIRHAESANNARPEHQRSEDPPITPTGQRQANFLAQWTQTLAIDVLITSPFLRTLQTTQEITSARPQAVQIWHDVFERGGCYRGFGPSASEGGMGLRRSEITQLMGTPEFTCKIDATIDEAGWWGGRQRETDDEARLRAQRVVQRMLDSFADDEPIVVVVTHADFKRLLLEVLLDGVLSPDRIGPLRNTGISKLNFLNNQWELDWLNSVSHLPSELITGLEY